jgi:hypothetical protein
MDSKLACPTNDSRNRGRTVDFPLAKPRKPSFGSRHGYPTNRIVTIAANQGFQCSSTSIFGSRLQIAANSVVKNLIACVHPQCVDGGVA